MSSLMKKWFFDGDIEAAKLDLDQLAELLQWLDETEARRQAEPDMFTLDDNNHTTVMLGADDTDPAITNPMKISCEMKICSRNTRWMC